ncbi:alpha/beta hydrolase [Actinotalea ferrariae]|uniref:alpha/beta fold hydrolase n=1 Tax=Actinotalea ferrariae TaxID=1386098 RepID=UPI001C8C97E8|nr:alpha/beta hydrolase [Actinotalea ferrariae]MBX9243200.1 alpha/beta hydrolase [Actinotalea ferrariae]
MSGGHGRGGSRSDGTAGSAPGQPGHGVGVARHADEAWRVPVLLLHGARASRTMWRAQVEAIERSGRRALAIDLPGHGRRRGETFTVEAGLEAVDAGVEALGGRALLVGLSLGGYLGIAWTARHDDAVGLVAAGCSTVPDQPITGAWRRAAQVIARLPDRGERLNQTLVDRALPPEARAALAEGGFALDVMVDMLGAVRALRPLEDLGRIRCPVWLVNGRWDHFRTQERAFARACPSARLVTIPRATHLVSLVQPVAFNRVLLGAASEVEARVDAARTR